ncbi:MAG: class GN sortase [Parvibaculum sp.]|nr:class GN sortase [Parvibaculum sp.]
MSAQPKSKAAALFWAAAISLCLAFGAWQLGHGLYIMAKAELAQLLLDRAWAKTLRDGSPHKAWSWADAWPVAKLEFPSLGTSHIVLSNASGAALAFGPGHLSGTPLPGEGGTTVIAAHRDTHFSNLRELENDHPVILTTANGNRQEYRISAARIVDARESGIDPRAGNALAIVTCYPFDAKERGPLRYVLFARPVEIENASQQFR